MQLRLCMPWPGCPGHFRLQAFTARNRAFCGRTRT